MQVCANVLRLQLVCFSKKTTTKTSDVDHNRFLGHHFHINITSDEWVRQTDRGTD